METPQILVLPPVILPTIEMTERELVQCHIAGLAHYDAKNWLLKIKPGMQTHLVREPTNTYDRYAVEVFIGTPPIKLGYIPGKISQIISTLLKYQYVLFSQISIVNIVAISSIKPYPLHITIHLV